MTKNPYAIEKHWKELESHISPHPNRYDREMLLRAFEFARNAHATQKRISGEPYVCHPLRTAITVAKFQIDTPTVAGALLHDVAEDTPITVDEIEKKFGSTVSFLVRGTTKLGHVKYRGVEEAVENLRKMMLAMAEDIRVILIKLADCFDNMQTLNALPKERQRLFALETMDLYAPIAHRLGISELAGDLHDLAFPYVYPEEHKLLMKNVEHQYEERKRYLEPLIPILEQELEKNNIKPLTIHARAKHYYSLYRKLLKKDMNLENIYDLVAMRVVVKTLEECYSALGIVHSLWRPLPGRIKDYIALPKSNGYKSIHTTVFGPLGKIIEIQIRTKEMHEGAERGIAAHWKYSEERGSKTVPKEFSWVNQLQNWQKEFNVMDDFIESLKIDFFKTRIFVITPKGDVVDLPDGSTPVDFAYHIHTDIGNQCAGARVDGKIAPLDHKLESGQVVEILTQKNKMPSEKWLEFVKTSFVKSKIRDEIRKKPSAMRSAAKPQPTQAEFRVIAKDRVGLIKDVSRVFAASNINIQNFSTRENAKYPILTVTCQLQDHKKANELTLKIRSIKNVETVSYTLRSPKIL